MKFNFQIINLKKSSLIRSDGGIGAPLPPPTIPTALAHPPSISAPMNVPHHMRHLDSMWIVDMFWESSIYLIRLLTLKIAIISHTFSFIRAK